MAARLSQRTLAPGARVDETLEPGVPVGSFRAADEEAALGALIQQRLVGELYGQLAESTRRAFLVATSEEPFPVQAHPNVRLRAAGTVIVVELPVVFEAVVPELAFRSTVEARTVAAIASTLPA